MMLLILVFADHSIRNVLVQPAAARWTYHSDLIWCDDFKDAIEFYNDDNVSLLCKAWVKLHQVGLKDVSSILHFLSERFKSWTINSGMNHNQIFESLYHVVYKIQQHNKQIH